MSQAANKKSKQTSLLSSIGQRSGSDKKSLKDVLSTAVREYPRYWRSLTVALFPPLFVIGLFRWLTDDYTGDQYALLIMLTSAFSTFVVARVAVVGWDMQQLRPLALYNSIMSRYFSALGLFVIASFFTIPMLGGLILSGLVLVADVSKWILVLSLPLLVGGFVLMSRIALALYALADDMDITVAQAFQISSRITKQHYLAYIWRLLLIGALIIGGSIALALVGTLVNNHIQDAIVQLSIDLFGGWLITPLLIFLMARLYQGLVEAYE
ncbi:hypothetical protein IT415_04040 [bacterium]|nr:hypothetical protein [bacterium]